MNPIIDVAQITPLGAAIVEALPNQKKANAIHRAFRRSGKCPTSAIYPTKEDVDKFYHRKPAKP